MATRTVSYSNWDELAIARVSDSSNAQKKAWQKAYEMRKIVAGDTSKMFGLPSEKESRGNESALSLGQMYDFIVTSFDEGKSNEILRGVRTLLFQVATRFPEIEFEDLGPVSAAINSGVCKQLLGPPPKGCAAVDEFKRALIDYLIGGMGFTFATFANGRPVIRCADSLDVSWDTTQQLPTRMRWVSVRFRQTLGEWIEWYQDVKNVNILRELAGKETISGADFDNIREVEFYFDIDGAKGKGTSYDLLRSRESGAALVLYKETTKYFYRQESGDTMPFLPVTPMYFMGLPSTRGSTSVVEMALPDQVAIWRDEYKQTEYIKRMGAVYYAQKGAMTPEQIEAFNAGEIGAVIEYDKSGEPPGILSAGEVPRSLLDHRDSHKQSLIGSLGANPYASGVPVQGTSFASESNQIGSMSQLTANAIAADYNGLWVDTTRKLLGLIEEYGDFPIDVRYNGTTIAYNASRPIKDVIVSDADISIREDSTVYMPRRDRINEAIADLNVAQTLGGMFPNAVKFAYENYLKAKGVMNIKDWMEPPQQMPAAVQDPSAMAGSDMAGANQ